MQFSYFLFARYFLNQQASIVHQYLQSRAYDKFINRAGEPSNPKEAVKWLYKASLAGHVRAQYQLALCLHQGRVVDCNIQEAVCNSFPCSFHS